MLGHFDFFLIRAFVAKYCYDPKSTIALWFCATEWQLILAQWQRLGKHELRTTSVLKGQLNLPCQGADCMMVQVPEAMPSG
jgi:hypothetical protein